MAYTSTTATLAMIEFLAHVDTASFDPVSPPALVVVTAEVDDNDILSLATIGATLPADWRNVPAPEELRAIGDAWIASGASLALSVRSTILPDALPERNVLINPLHARSSTITWRTDDFAYDPRLLS